MLWRQWVGSGFYRTSMRPAKTIILVASLRKRAPASDRSLGHFGRWSSREIGLASVRSAGLDASSDAGVGRPESDGTRQRPRARANAMSIVAALDNPPSILLADDSADVMGPDNDSANGRSSRVGAVVGPVARKVVLGTGISAHLRAHEPSAPCSRSSCVGIPVRVMMMMVAMRSGLRA